MRLRHPQRYHSTLRGGLAALLLLALSAGASAQSKNFPGELGAMVEKAGGTVKGVTFRVWAPNAQNVAVIGSFNNWDSSRTPLKKETGTGLWSVDVPEAKPGDEYLYLINGSLERRDPRGRQVSADIRNSVVYDTTAFDWGDAAKYQSTALLKDLVIYQLHPGTFFDPKPGDDQPGTLRDAITKLDHLKEIGVNCILLMPVNEFPGRHSWGYNPCDLFAIETTYGGPDALKEFVKECHKRDIAVHIDIVHNHYGPDNLSLWQFDGYGGGDTKAGVYFYEDNERGLTPWGPRPDFGRPEVRDFIADQIRMWFDEYKMDGLRWDSTVNIRAYNNGANVNSDGERLLHRLAKMIRQEYPGKSAWPRTPWEIRASTVRGNTPSTTVTAGAWFPSWSRARTPPNRSTTLRAALIRSWASAASFILRTTTRPDASTGSAASSPMSTKRIPTASLPVAKPLWPPSSP